jgi:hypothetical protein
MFKPQKVISRKLNEIQCAMKHLGELDIKGDNQSLVDCMCTCVRDAGRGTIRRELHLREQ